MELNDAEEKVLKIIQDMNLAKKSDIERELMNNGVGNVDLDAFIATSVEGLMRKSLITKIHPIGVACYIITRQGNNTLSLLSNTE